MKNLIQSDIKDQIKEVKKKVEKNDARLLQEKYKKVINKRKKNDTNN